MKLALLALAAFVPATVHAGDPAPYVVHEGRAVRPAPASPPPAASAPSSSPGAAAARAPSAFGTSSIQTGISSGSGFSAASNFQRSFAGSRSLSTRAARSTLRFGRRGVTGSTPAGGATPASSGPPPFAAIGAKIVSEGQPPVYSKAADAGTHSVEGGGFIALDQSRANDVARAPGIFWAPPDAPSSAGKSGGGGSGASANGPAASGASAGAPATAPQTNRGAAGATGFDASF